MPTNTEYVLAAYCIVIAVITFYAGGILLKLKSVNTRLTRIQNSQNTIPDETKKP